MDIVWDKWRACTINFKAITEVTKQRHKTNKPTKEIKWNHKNNPKEGRKIIREQRTDETNRKQQTRLYTQN